MKRTSLIAIACSSALGAVLALAAAPGHAGSRSAGFKVNIAMQAGSHEGCLHRTSLAARGATLTVTCQRGQFVDITPVPSLASWRAFGPPARPASPKRVLGPTGSPFAGTLLEPAPDDGAESETHAVTALQVAVAPGGLLEMLVVF